jgi:hypothetical protein
VHGVDDGVEDGAVEGNEVGCRGPGGATGGAEGAAGTLGTSGCRRGVLLGSAPGSPGSRNCAGQEPHRDALRRGCRVAWWVGAEGTLVQGSPVPLQLLPL